MENLMEYLPNMDIIQIIDAIVQEVAKKNWEEDECPPEFWVSLNNEDKDDQSIMISINHLGSKFTEKLFPITDTYYGYDSLLSQMIGMYNQTM